MGVDVPGFLAKVKAGLLKGVAAITSFFGTPLGAEVAVVVCYGFMLNLLFNALLNFW